jgi:hypothetical protein
MPWSGYMYCGITVVNGNGVSGYIAKNPGHVAGVLVTLACQPATFALHIGPMPRATDSASSSGRPHTPHSEVSR